MNNRRLSPLALSLFGLTVTTEMAAVWLSLGLEPSYDTFLYAVDSVVWAGAGALVASRQPRNPIGWLLCIFALVNAVMADAAQGWALRAVDEHWGGADAAYLVSSAGRQPSGLAWILTFLLFPGGRLPSRRWRAIVVLAVLGTALTMAGWSLSADLNVDFPSGGNPYAVTAVSMDALFAIGMVLTVGAFVAASALLVRRLRRSDGVERQQLKWIAFAATVATVVPPVALALWIVTPLAPVLIALTLTALPIAVSIAILRYRLYEIDLVINRTLVYGAVSVLLAAVFAATIVLLGTALGRGSAWATAGATLVAAVLFRPVRRGVQDAVDRQFNRARYDALHRMAVFLEELRAGRAAPEDVEGILREVVPEVDPELVFFLPGSGLAVDARGTVLPDRRADRRERFVIQAGDRPVGAVVHEPATVGQAALIRRLVEAGGLAIEIARLRVELRHQLAEVQASRVRIIAAGNVERRRIERDLHDGAQQRLVSIGLALRHAQHELRVGSADEAGRTLDAAVAEVAVAIDELRELARGLPPAQLDAGLGPAFRELARRAPVPILVKAPTERFEKSVEAAAYFVGCEGVTNAIKHANATRILLSAVQKDDRLVVAVNDDGVGGAAPVNGSGLTGLSDRVTALGGTLRITSDFGKGTTLRVELPCGS
jgi:signal transduction histidine kinase